MAYVFNKTLMGQDLSFIVRIIVSNNASSRSNLIVGEVVVIGVDHLHNWVGVLVVAVLWV